MISMYVQDRHQDWDLYLQFAICAYRSSYQPSLGDNPYFLMYGRDFVFPIDVTYELQINLKGMELAHYYSQKTLDKTQDSMVARVNNKRQDVRYEVGDLVWLFIPGTKAFNSCHR
eukprot:GILJ01003969.1.p1 GENE.GILJ01003969.1~~GILJ01003969.1.p1  ORF type:complete len:115 (-),score=6.26 GILJ01003969.1:154-498(-)